MVDFEVYLQGGPPWGFRLQGGREFRMPIRIAKVEPGGKAHNGGVKVGDHVTEIEEVSTTSMYHTEALTAVKRAQYSLSLLLTRPDKKEGADNASQQVGAPPEISKTKLSVVIGPQRSHSSERIASSASDDDGGGGRTEIPHGQTYMKKLVRNKTMDADYPPVIRSKSLPRNAQPDSGSTSPHSDYSTKSLPRNAQKDQPNENGVPHHPEYSSKSLPRTRTKSTTDVPSKAPSWYKDMYKEMNTSMEKESLLTKLLASDAKKGAFRKYDGTKDPLVARSTENVLQASTFEDVPRRLRRDGDGRSIANHPNRKSLPNIHAASFNFMDHNNTKADHANKPQSNASHDWYRHIQKGGEIPETGLASKTDSTSKLNKPKSSPQITRNWETMITAPDTPPDILPAEIAVPKPKNIMVEYNNPPDFLELRRQEIKNKELEKEREEIRDKRERERLGEEARLLEQKTRDFRKIEEEKRRLELKEEELKLKEKLLMQQQEEHEERRLQNELHRKENDEMRLLRLKEEELQRKEEMLLKQEQELEELRQMKFKEEEHRRLEEKQLHRLREEEESKRQQIIEEQQSVEEKRKRREIEKQRILEEEVQKQREEEDRRQKQRGEEDRRQKQRGEEDRRQKQREEEDRRQKQREEEDRRQKQREEEDRRQKQREEEDRRQKQREEDDRRRLRELEEKRKRKEAEEEERVRQLKEEEEREERERQRLLKLKQEDLQRKEEEEKRILKLKEEELQRKEEELLRKEEEQREQERLLEESLKPPPLPPFGLAKYSFHPQGPGELQFKKGEIITILEAVDENWIEGEVNGNIGIFPVSYIELLDLSGEESPKTKTIDELNHDIGLDSKYIEPSGTLLVDDTPPEEPEIISTAGIPLENGPSLLENDLETLENAVMVEELENTPEEHISDTDVVDIAVSLQTDVEPGLAYARYAFRAETDSELSFKKGEEIVLLKRVDDNWYEGEINGNIGILPVNYVNVEREPVMTEPPPPKPEPEPEPEPEPVVVTEPLSLANIVTEPTPENVLKSVNTRDRRASAEMILDDVLSAHERGKKAKEEPAMVNGHNHMNGDEPMLDHMNSDEPMLDHMNGDEPMLDELIGQGEPHKAIYKFASSNEDEIELRVGDVVHVLEKCDDNWYIGTSERTGAFGTFPGNYVVPL